MKTHHQEKCEMVEIKPHDVGTGYMATEKKSIEEVSAPSPHTEGVEEKIRNIVSEAMSAGAEFNVEPNQVGYQQTQKDLVVELLSILHQTREDTLAEVRKKNSQNVGISIKKHPKKHRIHSLMTYYRKKGDTQKVAELRQRLKGGGK